MIVYNMHKQHIRNVLSFETEPIRSETQLQTELTRSVIVLAALCPSGEKNSNKNE